MRRVREKLIKLDVPREMVAGICAYAYRHTFTTDGLVGGVDPATMATLLGHSSITMIERRDGHLDQKDSHLTQSVARVAQARIHLEEDRRKQEKSSGDKFASD